MTSAVRIITDVSVTNNQNLSPRGTSNDVELSLSSGCDLSRQIRESGSERDDERGCRDWRTSGYHSRRGDRQNSWRSCGINRSSAPAAVPSEPAGWTKPAQIRVASRRLEQSPVTKAIPPTPHRPSHTAEWPERPDPGSAAVQAGGVRSTKLSAGREYDGERRSSTRPWRQFSWADSRNLAPLRKGASRQDRFPNRSGRDPRRRRERFSTSDSSPGENAPFAKTTYECRSTISGEVRGTTASPAPDGMSGWTRTWKFQVSERIPDRRCSHV